MAKLKSPLLGKLKRALEKHFPPPATIRIEDEDGNGIIGIIRSSEFEPIDRVERQRMIRQMIGEELSKEEQRQVLIVIGVTPDESDGYLPDPYK